MCRERRPVTHKPCLPECQSAVQIILKFVEAFWLQLILELPCTNALYSTDVPTPTVDALTVVLVHDGVRDVAWVCVCVLGNMLVSRMIVFFQRSHETKT